MLILCVVLIVLGDSAWGIYTFGSNSEIVQADAAIVLEASTYEGLIHGFDNNLFDYHGPFVSVSVGVDIPQLRIISGSVGGFSSAIDSSPCAPNFRMWGVAASVTPGLGYSPFFISGSLSCTIYTMQRMGYVKYPKGLEGGLMMAYAILFSYPLDPIREYAAESAI